MSLAQNTDSLTGLTDPRYKMAGMSLTKTQCEELLPAGCQHITRIIPSSSSASFGSVVVYDLKDINSIPQDITLQFNVSPITGLSGSVANYPHFSPATLWISRVEIVINGIVIDTVYGTDRWLLKQLFLTDSERSKLNSAEGHYSSMQQRNIMSSTTSDYFVELKTPFSQFTYPILTPNHFVQLRVYMNSLTNIVSQSTLTGTPVATINYSNLIVRSTQIPQAVGNNLLMSMSKVPFDNLYHQLRFMTSTINSGVSNASIIMTGITGKVMLLLFTIQTATATTQDGAYAFNPISNFAILNSSNENMVGGQNISSSIWLNYLSAFLFPSSYLQETSTAVLPALTTVNNSSYVYGWVFGNDAIDSINFGRPNGSKQFTGAETLNITLPSALTASATVNIYALVETDLKQNPSGVQVINL